MPTSTRKRSARLQRASLRRLRRDTPRRNDSYKWDLFDSEKYVEENYKEPFADDLQVLLNVRAHFVKMGPVGGEGVDVGAGANLYPTLAMLPFCSKIRLLEHSASNRRWLASQIGHYDATWDRYWELLAPTDPVYNHISPREVVRDNVTVHSGNILQLPQRPQWSIGTMFFVAESISERKGEFYTAVRRFVGALKPGAPFAAAFMQESPGYTISKVRFPAVSVTVADVRHSLTPYVDDFSVERIFSGQLLRPDYRGMILALGRAGKTRH
jgi:hypothetical protein